MTRNDLEAQDGSYPTDALGGDQDAANGAPTAYRLLYFRSSVLEDWELLETRNLMEALQAASSRAPDLTVELWSERKKVAIFRPVNRH